MKKIIGIILMAGLFCTSIFAQGFTVTKLTGQVTYESAPGVWTKLKNGDKITEKTVIDVGLHSQIDFTGDDGKAYTVKAMKKGTIESLITKTAGLKKSSTSASSTVKGDTSSSKTISTASSRASEAKDDIDWAE